MGVRFSTSGFLADSVKCLQLTFYASAPRHAEAIVKKYRWKHLTSILLKWCTIEELVLHFEIPHDFELAKREELETQVRQRIPTSVFSGRTRVIFLGSVRYSHEDPDGDEDKGEDSGVSEHDDKEEEVSSV
ncbi:hypothetical protein WG66_002272 [Moniliophthora roreri]|nr:hypothetical protein WG66_002272 [Moniliophthora roreri]